MRNDRVQGAQGRRPIAGVLKRIFRTSFYGKNDCKLR